MDARAVPVQNMARNSGPLLWSSTSIEELIVDEDLDIDRKQVDFAQAEGVERSVVWVHDWCTTGQIYRMSGGMKPSHRANANASKQSLGSPVKAIDDAWRSKYILSLT